MVFALVFQFLVMLSTMSGISETAAADSQSHYDQYIGAAWETFAISLLVVLPLTVIVGVLQTFKTAGPMVRFSQFLTAIRDGGKPADCRIRKGDLLQEFCTLLNDATRSIREDGDARREERADAEADDQLAA